MKKQTFGAMISSLRKSKAMTQLELADKMGVTDKAVSKWERDLSYPDINSIPKLAEIFGISVDELMQVKTKSREITGKKDYKSFISLVFKCIALAMGVAVAVLSIMNKVDVNSAFEMLGVGLACLAISQLPKKREE